MGNRLDRHVPRTNPTSHSWAIDGSILQLNGEMYILCSAYNALVFAPYDGTAAFAESATWYIREGLSDPEWISFEAYNMPGFFIGKRFGVMALIENNGTLTDAMREEATFLEER